MADKEITSEYRIRKHTYFTYYNTQTGEPYCFYTIEYCWLNLGFIKLWAQKNNFKPIHGKSEFDSIKEAKEVLTKYDRYIKGLLKDKSIVETIKL
jgi:hypothetical protein